MSGLSELQVLRDLGIDFNPMDFYGKLTPQKLLDKARETIIHFSRKIEEGAKEYHPLNEDGISNLFKDFSNSFVFTVTRETNSRGHVDLTFIAPLFTDESNFNYKGEAKIWSSYRKAIDGFKQLNGYLTGLPPYGFMLFYYKTQECEPQFKEYEAKLIAEEGGAVTSKNSRYFYSSHTHFSGADVTIDHYAVHIPKSK
jgi:hypothetical protein